MSDQLLDLLCTAMCSCSPHRSVQDEAQGDPRTGQAAPASWLAPLMATTPPPGATAGPAPVAQHSSNGPAAAAGTTKGGRRPRSSSSVSLGVYRADRTEKEKREKGQVFKCEKCSKVYRHPQCLVKHRWEHTIYWADASKLMLSKHQQVQMLEAAAILSAPYGSLPESRSLWPASVSPSTAGLFGSDRVNLDLLRTGGSPEIGTARLHHHHNASEIPRIAGADGDYELDADMEDDGSEVSDEDGGPMFDMSINGDDGQSTSGASTADTTSGKASGSGSGDDEKDSGYASGPTAAKVPGSTAASEAKDIAMGGTPGQQSTAGNAGRFVSISAPPPMGYFDRRDRMSHQGSAVTSPAQSVAPLPSVNASSPHFGAYIPYPATSPSFSVVSLGHSFCRPAEMSSPSSFFVPPPYAASNVRGTSKAEEHEAMEEDHDERERWRRDDSDEVADMEL